MTLRLSAWKCVFVVSAIVAVLLSVGCDRQAAPPLRTAAAAEVVPDEDTGKGAGYAYAISYPSLDPQWHALDSAIRQFATARKKDFLDASNAPDRVAGTDYTLDLNFAVARRTADFVSVTASGSSFIGGAHGMPILASFNLDIADGKLKTLSDLFADAQTGLQAVSVECRRQLEGRYEAKLRADPGSMTPAQQDSNIQSMKRWIEKGTQPAAGNFDVFLIDGLDTRAIGVTVIFPPYQVAAYADGPQQVEVPAKVFYDLLKPEYKDAFAIDTEANKPAQGVR
jgi:hypothetical protein